MLVFRKILEEYQSVFSKIFDNIHLVNCNIMGLLVHNSKTNNAQYFQHQNPPLKLKIHQQKPTGPAIIPIIKSIIPTGCITVTQNALKFIHYTNEY